MAETPHIMLVEARFYAHIADELARGAIAALDAAGASYERFAVPGAFEIPAAIRFAVEAATRGARRERFDGFVALGCIVRGETDHYEFICRATMEGLMHVALQFGLALGTGLLTCDTLVQAEARSGSDGHNKGAEAAAAALLQIGAARRLGAV